ncbi:probably inactive leucine-rich repeat receptor-like protein kinase At5g48380 [Pistacia vera]|uniref:probably inactive leucine-rich repeat receptor-like protein kinase At5g48380 n=1 Tax=Pistacia vera TaxID=55513 RepID=UPI001263CFB1|nr:probably inactive leucine-rich repeat receptor-like protein kinase At5g48380 [Pistacia vera]
MAFNSRVFYVIFIYTLVWHLGCVTFSLCSEEDIACLRALKHSFEDPLNRLTWSFDNLTAASLCKLNGVECWNDNDNDIRLNRLSLVDMGLKGLFPRGIRNCSYLTHLDLSGNNLFGPIPEDIAYLLRFCVRLDLSNNRFSGEIPSSISNVTYLNILMLDNNLLTGQIPKEIVYLRWIKEFSVSNNMLSGPVPNFVNLNVSEESYANNSGLCGGPLEPCKYHRWKFDYSFKSGFLVGYVISTVVAVTVFISYCFPWVAVKGKKKITIAAMVLLMIKRMNKKYEADQLNQSPPLCRQLKIAEADQVGKEIAKLENLIARMNLAFISNATNNFSEDNVIGMGQMGTMYKSTLSNGQPLAVKKLHDCPYLEEQFMFELKTLVRLRQSHNLVQLLGFCLESNERLLAYEYMSNGNLYDWLHPAEGEPRRNMEWPLRVKIATGVARGLAWLHHKFEIVHLDISSKCILLDHNFESKLSNFKQSMHLNPNGECDSTKEFCGNREFWHLDFIKEDVHSFGLVVLELITGKEPSEIDKSSYSFERITHLSESSSKFPDYAIDKSLIGQRFDDEILQLLEVASQCVHPFPHERPTMLQVYKSLSKMIMEDEVPEIGEITETE